MNHEEKLDVPGMDIQTYLNIVVQNFTKGTIRKLQNKKVRNKCTFTYKKFASNVHITNMYQPLLTYDLNCFPTFVAISSNNLLSYSGQEKNKRNQTLFSEK